MRENNFDGPIAKRCPIGQRIAVVGTTGSGKTTLAHSLALRLGVPHIELDALHWEQGWQEAEPAVFRARVMEALGGATWVVDGNYSKARDLIWARADTIVWLDYPITLVLWQLLKRTLQRTMGKVELWNGNRESLCVQFLTRDSLFLWALQTHWKHRREYPRLLNQPQHAHLIMVRLRSRQEVQAWLVGIG
jgi:adenylate kinase family enzyme